MFNICDFKVLNFIKKKKLKFRQLNVTDNAVGTTFSLYPAENLTTI